MEQVRAHELGLADYALDALKELEGIRVFGPADPARRGCPISFELPDVARPRRRPVPRPGGDLRPGRPPLHKAADACALGVTATARASTHVYSLRDEIDALVRGLHGARAYFA